MVGKILGNEYEVNTRKAFQASCGTSGQGEIEINYKILENVLGMPEDGDGYKTDAEWDILNIKTGNIITLYNWKNGRNYNGCRAPKVQNIKEWSIGGNNKGVVDELLDLLKRYERLEKLDKISD